MIDLLGSASLLAGILGSIVNLEGKRGTCSEFVESYFLEVFCKVKSCEGANGTTADDGDALGRGGGGGHSVDGGTPQVLKSPKSPNRVRAQIFGCGNFLKILLNYTKGLESREIVGDSIPISGHQLLHCSLIQRHLEGDSLPIKSDMASPPPSKKRKRLQEPETTEVSPNVAQEAPESTETETPKVLTSLEKSNVQKKIFHAIKEAGRAFKKARDFEIRKIIKRMKAAKYTSTTGLTENRDAGEVTKVERLEKELQIAKVLAPRGDS